MEKSIYENESDNMFNDIKNGAGWADYDYVLNAKHSPLSQKERVRLLIKLAKAGILVDGDHLNKIPDTKEQIPRKFFMSVQDLEKKYKSRTNPGINEIKKPNFNELKPVTGDYNFSKLSNISDMNNKIEITKKEFDTIHKKLKRDGVDILSDDREDFYTIFSAGDNYNLVKVNLKENINEETNNKLSKGVKLQYTYETGMSIELIQSTKRGWKVKQTDEYSPSRKKLRKPKVTTQFYSTGDLTGGQAPWKPLSEAKYGYTDGEASYMKNHGNESKEATTINKSVGKNEMKFYDVLQNMEDKIGHPKFMKWMSAALRGFNVDMFKDPKIKNPSEAQEALYLLSK